MNIIEFINSAAAETTGGLITASIVSLVAKLKDALKGKSITQEALNELIEENAEIKEILMRLQDELTKGNIINNSEKIEIKNQFNNSIINNPTFNFDSNNKIEEDLKRKNKLLSYEIQDIYKQMNYQIDEEITLELETNFFIAEQSILGGIEKIRILVKCLYKEENTIVPINEIQIFDSEYNSNKARLKVDKGFLITNTYFESYNLVNIKCIIKDDLYNGILNVNDALKIYIKEYEKEEIFQRYIELMGKIKEIDQNIVDYLLKEILKKNNTLYTIFGDFGTGKSTILNKICYETSKIYLINKSFKNHYY